MLTALWNADVIQQDTYPESGMPRAAADPSHAGNPMVSMIDMRRAWDRVELERNHRIAVYLHYGHGWTQKQIGLQLGMPQQTVSDALARAVSLVEAELNGTTYIEAEEN